MSSSHRPGYHLSRFSDQPWSTLWKTAVVRLPRAVPMQALKYTSPEGPQPFELKLPSRGPKRSIPLFVFVPPNDGSKPEKFPVIVDFHGGGFYLGSCLEQAPFCAKLARELRAVVIGVDYRMAPFDQFPAPIEDAEDVVSAILDPKAPGYAELRQGVVSYERSLRLKAEYPKKEDRKRAKQMPPTPDIQLDTTRIAFSGASSGGNIALNLALSVPQFRENEAWPSRVPANYPTQIPLLLLYPSLDLRQLPSERLRNERMPVAKDPRGWGIDDELAAKYVSRDQAGHPRASPGLVDVAHGLHKNAKALLILTGIDTLWEQSETWVKKVEAEGRSKDVKVMRYDDRKHGWTVIPEIALSETEKRTRMEVLDECVRFVEVAWQGGDPVKALQKEVGDVIEPKKDSQGGQNMIPDATPNDSTMNLLGVATDPPPEEAASEK